MKNGNLKCGFVGHTVLMHYFYETSPPVHTIDQTNQVYTNDEEEMVYLNFTFHDP